jgi:dihydrofolate reductase
MRKVVAYELLSLDGVAESPDLFITEWDEVMQENLNRVIASQDTVLLGHRMYDEWSEFWPKSDIEPFATFINGVEKFVATSTAAEPTWANDTLIDSDFPTFVTELKRRPGNDIGVHGSIELLQSLLEAGVVDELCLVIGPTVFGHGRKLFAKELANQLTLTRCFQSPAGYLLVDYQIKN